MKACNGLRRGHIRKARERLGLSRQKLGRLAGFTRNAASYIANVETGQSRVNEPRVVAAIARVIEERRATRWMADRQHRRLEEEQARIAAQEALWAAVPDSPEKAALLEAMLDRCLDLMFEGSGEECDAIAEWLPTDRIQGMFAEWERLTTPEKEITDDPTAADALQARPPIHG